MFLSGKHAGMTVNSLFLQLAKQIQIFLPISRLILDFCVLIGYIFNKEWILNNDITAKRNADFGVLFLKSS